MTLAITKILHIGEGSQRPGRYLMNAIRYITVPDKTGDGRFIGGKNCIPEFAYEKMKETKRLFAKTDKRQAYHIIISFEEGEITADKAFEFMDRFVDAYIGDEYEAVYAVHDNTDHIHGHIIFNSVNRLSGLKYRYKKGDWAKYIQPITNRLCEEYGLSTIKIDEEMKEDREFHDGLNHLKGTKNIWSDMIRRDVDAAIYLASSFDGFLSLLTERGYEVKTGKHLAIRPPGMERFRRCETLGSRYTEESIRNRIQTETISTYQRDQDDMRILRVKIPYHLRRAKLTGMQKKYFRRLYETGRLKKRPYSKAWKYRDDIRRFKKLQAQYLFLADYEIHDEEKLIKVREELEEKRLEFNRIKGEIYKENAKYKAFFDIVDRIDRILPAEMSFREGDEFFLDEHREYESLNAKLTEAGYTYDEVKYFKENGLSYSKELKERSIAISRDIHTADEIIAESSEARSISKVKEKRDKKQIIGQSR